MTHNQKFIPDTSIATQNAQWLNTMRNPVKKRCDSKETFLRRF